MDATSNFSLGFAQASGSKAGLPERLLSRQGLERIVIGLSLISQCLAFSSFGMLIIANPASGRPECFCRWRLGCDAWRHQRSFSWHCVHYRRFSVLEVPRPAFGRVGVQQQYCPPYFRETRVSRRNCFASLRVSPLMEKIYDRRYPRK